MRASRRHAGFQKEMDLNSGDNAFAVEAVDANNNVKTNNYVVTVSAGVDQEIDYDPNGNVVERRGGAGGGTRILEWDAENRLLAVQSAAAPLQESSEVNLCMMGTGVEFNRLKKYTMERNGRQ